MIKISTYIYIYIYIKKVCHYNKWSLKINLFTKVFINRSVFICGRTQPYLHRSIDVKFIFDSERLGLLSSAKFLEIADVALRVG